MKNADAFIDLSEPEKFDYMVLDSIDYVVFTAAISDLISVQKNTTLAGG